MAGFAFNEAYYIKSKLAQLHAKGENDANGNAYTEATLRAAIENAGMSVQQHYERYSTKEGTSCNPYFNTTEYLEAKLAQLNSIQEDGHSWTMDMLMAALEKSHLTAEQHYLKYGCHEKDADGKYINPSNAFDVNAYAAAKLAELQKSPTDAADWADKTADDVMQAIVKVGLTPISHYEKYGQAEAEEYDVAMVQTVPVVDRVANDELRSEMGENVPSNYNSSTPAPGDVAASEAAAVTKPCDMADESTVKPEEPVATPADSNYVEVPGGGIQDTNENPVVLFSAEVKDQDGKVIASTTEYAVQSTATKDGVTTTTLQPVTDEGKVDEEATPLQTTTVEAETGKTTTTTNLATSDGGSVSQTASVVDDGNGTVTTTSETEVKDAEGATVSKVETEESVKTNADGSTETKSTEKVTDAQGKTTTTETTSTADAEGNSTGSVEKVTDPDGKTTTTTTDAEGKQTVVEGDDSGSGGGSGGGSSSSDTPSAPASPDTTPPTFDANTPVTVEVAQETVTYEDGTTSTEWMYTVTATLSEAVAFVGKAEDVVMVNGSSVSSLGGELTVGTNTLKIVFPAEGSGIAGNADVIVSIASGQVKDSAGNVTKSAIASEAVPAPAWGDMTAKIAENKLVVEGASDGSVSISVAADGTVTLPATITDADGSVASDKATAGVDVSAATVAGGVTVALADETLTAYEVVGNSLQNVTVAGGAALTNLAVTGNVDISGVTGTLATVTGSDGADNITMTAAQLAVVGTGVDAADTVIISDPENTIATSKGFADGTPTIQLANSATTLVLDVDDETTILKKAILPTGVTEVKFQSTESKTIELAAGTTVTKLTFNDSGINNTVKVSSELFNTLTLAKGTDDGNDIIQIKDTNALLASKIGAASGVASVSLRDLTELKINADADATILVTADSATTTTITGTGALTYADTMEGTGALTLGSGAQDVKMTAEQLKGYESVVADSKDVITISDALAGEDDAAYVVTATNQAQIVLASNTGGDYIAAAAAQEAVDDDPETDADESAPATDAASLNILQTGSGEDYAGITVDLNAGVDTVALNVENGGEDTINFAASNGSGNDVFSGLATGDKIVFATEIASGDTERFEGGKTVSDGSVIVRIQGAEDEAATAATVKDLFVAESGDSGAMILDAEAESFVFVDITNDQTEANIWSAGCTDGNVVVTLIGVISDSAGLGAANFAGTAASPEPDPAP